MSEPQEPSSARCAQSVAGTLADVERQIAARITRSRAAARGARPDASTSAAQGEDVGFDSDVVVRLAADEVIETNRGISQRSLRDFLS